MIQLVIYQIATVFCIEQYSWLHIFLFSQTGPIIYRSRTIFEDASPELVRDFFWDDDFRSKWDSMLAYFKILEEFPESGTTIVHWVKKVLGRSLNSVVKLEKPSKIIKADWNLYFSPQFPFFCSDREYIIGRRIWEYRKTYYCVTKV